MFPPGSTVRIHAGIDPNNFLHHLADVDGRLAMVVQDVGSAVYVLCSNLRIMVPQEAIGPASITLIANIMGLAMYTVQDCEAAIRNALGTPEQIDHGMIGSGDPHYYVEGVWNLVPLPGEGLHAIAWRTAVAAWRGGRPQARFPTPMVQIRMFTDYGTAEETPQGEWFLGNEQYDQASKLYPNLNLYKREG